MRVLFMGTPPYATVIFKELCKHESFEIVSLITQPDKPVGRKRILTPPDIKKFVTDHDMDVEIYQPETLRSSESIDYIRSKRPDFIVVAAFGQILPEDILDIAVCINLHASLLPAYRGASPIQSAILDMQKYSGVTAMKMDEGLDTGDILSYSVTNIKDSDAAGLFDKLSQLAAKLCVDTLIRYNDIKPIKQTGCNSSYAKKITKTDGRIDLDDAKRVFAKYRAYTFWPGIYLKSGLKLKKLALKDENGNYNKGEILATGKESIIAGCTKGAVEIFRVQPPSKKEMTALDYIRGKRLNIGDTLS